MTSIVRAVEVPNLWAPDYPYDESKLLIWTAAELATTIIAASIPVLRALFNNIINSSYQKRGHTGTRGSNAYQSATYVGSARSRSDSFPRTGSIAICTSTSQKQKGSGALSNIYENGESVASLIIESSNPDIKDFGLEHGGILKTEVITVNYDTRSQRSNAESNGTDTLQDIELQQISPNYVRGKSL